MMNKIILALCLIALVSLFAYTNWEIEVETIQQIEEVKEIEVDITSPYMNYKMHTGLDSVSFMYPADLNAKNMRSVDHSGIVFSRLDFSSLAEGDIIYPLAEIGIYHRVEQVGRRGAVTMVIMPPLENIRVEKFYGNNRISISVLCHAYMPEDAIMNLPLEDSYFVRNESDFTSYRKFVENEPNNHYVYYYVSNTTPTVLAIIHYDEAFKEEFDDYIDIFERTITIFE